MRKHIEFVVLLAALLTLLTSALPAIASAGPALNSYEQQLVACINLERAQHGLAQLHVNSALVSSARTHSADMGQRKYFDHNVPGGETWQARVIRSGYTVRGYKVWKAGENIYWGANLMSSPVAAVDAWMQSAAHRAVILTKGFRDIGVGAVQAPDGGGQASGPVWFFTLDVGVRTK
ncbi:MAG: CAP domain-containing protein [Actinomycetes bacterium]